MQAKKPKKSKLPLILIPYEHCDEVRHRLERLRVESEPHSLEYACAKLKESLCNDFGITVDRTRFVPGKRYAVLGYSIGANAVRGNKVVTNHGEVYLYLWTYYEDGIFRQEDAWGGVHENLLPGCPIIEAS